MRLKGIGNLNFRFKNLAFTGLVKICEVPEDLMRASQTIEGVIRKCQKFVQSSKSRFGSRSVLKALPSALIFDGSMSHVQSIL